MIKQIIKNFESYSSEQMYLMDPFNFIVNPNNNYIIEDESIDKMVRVIQEKGQIQPILISKQTGNVLGGNTRLLACQRDKERNNNDRKIKVLFIDCPDTASEFYVMQMDNKTYDDQRTEKIEGLEVYIRVLQIKEMKKNKEFYNGKGISSVNEIVATEFGITSKMVEKLVTKCNKITQNVEDPNYEYLKKALTNNE